MMIQPNFVKRRVLFLTLLTIALLGRLEAQPAYPRVPGEAQLIYKDLQHFSEAFKQLNSASDTLSVLQEYYFGKATPGLKEFINRHNLTPEMLRDALAMYPERYALIPGFVAEIDQVEQTYSELMEAFGAAVPNAMYAPTYLLVDANRGIGQASQVGQLVTITRVVDNPEKLQKLITHELSHFQQAMAMGGQKYAALYSSPDNMLGLCLREGGAEFITSLVLNTITQSASLEFLEMDEEKLKEQFMKDLSVQKKDYWLWDSIGRDGQPQLLGYVMGYKVCQAYYEKSADKPGALQTILKMPDASEFLVASGYFKR